MNFEDVGRVWREEGTGDFRRRKVESLSGAQKRARRTARRIKRVHLQETLAAVVMIPFFARAAVNAPSTLWAIGATVIVLSCVVIVVRLWTTRREHRPRPELSVRESLRLEIERLRDHEKLLAGVLMWYVAPPLSGVLLMVAGGSVNAAGEPVSARFRAMYAIAVVAFGWLIVALNRRAARQRLRPLREDLESWLAGLEAFDSGIDGGAEPQGGT